MKVTGPKGNIPIPNAVSDLDLEKSKAKDASAFKELIKSADASPSIKTSFSSFESELKAKLKAGELSHKQIVDFFVEKTIEIKAKNLPSDVQDKLREALQKTMINDPWLSEKVRNLSK